MFGDHSSPGRVWTPSHISSLLRLYHLPLREVKDWPAGVTSQSLAVAAGAGDGRRFEGPGQHCFQTQIPIFINAHEKPQYLPLLGSLVSIAAWNQKVKPLLYLVLYPQYLKSAGQPRRCPQLREPNTYQSVMAAPMRQRGLLRLRTAFQRKRRERRKRRRKTAVLWI